MKIKNVLITAGPTRERIDPVRFISNRSSGKMGYALAEAAQKKGFNVTLISGPVNIPDPENIQVVRIDSAEEMACEVRKYAEHSDLIIMAAAVADYRPTSPSPLKIKKNDVSLTIKLERTADILAELGRMKKDQILAGFAAETDRLIENARKKLISKNLDWIIANDVSRNDAGFHSENNEVTMISKNGINVNLPLKSKQLIAAEIIKILSESTE